MTKKAEKRQAIKDKTGINFVQHIFYNDVVFRRERCYVKCHPDNPWEFEIVSEERYNEMCANLEFREDNDWYSTYRLVPLDTNVRKLHVLEEKEYNRLTEAGLWAEVLDDLEIYNWEHFDRAYAELNKRKKSSD